MSDITQEWVLQTKNDIWLLTDVENKIWTLASRLNKWTLPVR